MTEISNRTNGGASRGPDLLDRWMQEPPQWDKEREACVEINSGFHLKPPPSPHVLSDFFTTDSDLFETIHMGAAVIDEERWQIVVDGLVRRPYSLSLAALKQLPQHSVVSFHECYGSPLKPPTTALWRVGNVKWTGVRLSTLLEKAKPLPEAEYVWSDGLDSGEFAGKVMDRYQKDLPMDKATQPEVLLAYELNGKPLRKERGGPVRLIVPGWFGTNSTKWICKISLRKERSSSHFTTTWYNEVDPTKTTGARRPVWKVEPNSMIVEPAPDAQIRTNRVTVRGWAWSNDGISKVDISLDNGTSWTDADVEPRVEHSWQAFSTELDLQNGQYSIMASAVSTGGLRQPLKGRRNHVHVVAFSVAAE